MTTIGRFLLGCGSLFLRSLLLRRLRPHLKSKTACQQQNCSQSSHFVDVPLPKLKSVFGSWLLDSTRRLARAKLRAQANQPNNCPFISRDARTEGQRAGKRKPGAEGRVLQHTGKRPSVAGGRRLFRIRLSASGSRLSAFGLWLSAIDCGPEMTLQSIQIPKPRIGSPEPEAQKKATPLSGVAHTKSC